MSRLWCNRDGGRSPDGTDELLTFVLKVYEDLIKEENKVLGGIRTRQGVTIQSVCSLQLFCQMDIAIVWNSASEKFHYTVNDVQEGCCGLFGTGDEARMTIPWAFVDAIERGALAG